MLTSRREGGNTHSAPSPTWYNPPGPVLTLEHSNIDPGAERRVRRELAAEGVLSVDYVGTHENTSDVLTKVLPVDAHWKHAGRALNL